MRSLALVVMGCAPQVSEPDDSAPVDTNVPPASPPPPTPPPAPPSTFREGTWRVDGLVLLDEADLDGDGVTDNKLPDVLAAVDLLLGGGQVSVDAVNAGVAQNLAGGLTVVFLTGTSDGQALTVHVLPGTPELTVDPAAWDAQGLPLAELTGMMVAERDFQAEGKVQLPVTFLPGTDPALVQLDAVHAVGELDPTSFYARAAGGIPVQRFVDSAVAPLIPPEGFEITPGNLLPRDEVLALVGTLALAASDVTLPSGEAAVSAAFELNAAAWTFDVPPTP